MPPHQLIPLKERLAFLASKENQKKCLHFFESSSYHFFFPENLKQIKELLVKEKPLVLLIEASYFLKNFSKEEIKELHHFIAKKNIISFILLNDIDEADYFKKCSWPKSYFYLGSFPSQAFRKRFENLLKERVFLEAPVALVLSDDDYFISQIEARLQKYHIRVHSFSSESCFKEIKSQLNEPFSFILCGTDYKNKKEKSFFENMSLEAPLLFVSDSIVQKTSLDEISFYPENSFMHHIFSILKQTRQQCRDHSTGVFLEHSFFEILERESNSAKRDYESFAVLRLNCKELDSYRNSFGDIFVEGFCSHLALFISNRIRASDFVARNDQGDIYLILLKVDRSLATLVAERIKKSFSEMASFENGFNFNPTIDYDLKIFPHESRSIDELIDFLKSPQDDLKDQILELA